MGEKQKWKTRREFLRGAGAVVAGGVIGGVVGAKAFPREEVAVEVPTYVCPYDEMEFDTLDSLVAHVEAEHSAEVPVPIVYAASEGYLLVDTKKCASCQSCMLACSLVHEGKENTSIARIQILQDSFGHFPDDIEMGQCRQCVYPVCILACPSGAFHVDADNGNVRTIDEGKCKDYQDSIAPDVCQLCVWACPYLPSVAVWNHGKGVALVCDLCADAPYWPEIGGVDGKQACVEVCPMKAIKFIARVPMQAGNIGYDVNLRTANSEKLGLAIT